MASFIDRLLGRKAPNTQPSDLSRRILVKGPDLPAIKEMVDGYGKLGRAGPVVPIGFVGSLDGAFALIIPPELPSFHFHNLSLWLLGLDPATRPQVLAVCRHADPVWSYHLAPDARESDLLRGWREDDSTLTLYVPENLVFLGETVVMPTRTLKVAMGLAGLPPALLEAPEEGSIPCTPEDLKGSMNPSMAPSDKKWANFRQATF